MIPQASGKSNPSIEGGETRTMRKFRRGACFVRHDQCSTRLDRNDKARIIYTAEKLELRTKPKGKKSGALGQSGLQVLRCLLFQCHNAATGRCDPGYTAIQGRTGLCRQAIADAIKRLEATGIICALRRLARDGWRVVQATNAYTFPASTPVHPPSLDHREEPPVQKFIPYAELRGDLRNALDALAARVARKDAHEESSAMIVR
jgi:hypothetical protein